MLHTLDRLDRGATFTAKAQVLQKILIILFIGSAGFSSAPGFAHNGLTIPSILSYAIILNGFYIFKIRGIKDIISILFLSCILFGLLNYLFISTNSNKALTYYLAHCWFAALIYYIFLSSKYLLFTKKEVLFAASIGLIPTLVIFPLEAFLPFWGIDIGSLIPRVERRFYELYSGFGFFRARGFTYESSYAAMFLNIYFCIIFCLERKWRPEIFLVWLLFLLLTASIAQLLIFSLFIPLIVFRHLILKISFVDRVKIAFDIAYDFGVLRWNLWLIVGSAFFIICLANIDFVLGVGQAAVKWVFQNITNQTVSANYRVENFKAGVELLKTHGLYGAGFGSIREAGYIGLTSFYLSLVVQLGALAIPFIVFVVYFFTTALRTGDFFALFCLLSSFLHLLIIDVFYLPPIFVAIFFLGWRLKDQVVRDV